MKPLFFLVLYIGLIINLKIKAIKEYLITMLTIISIFFGLPIKEYSDYFDFYHLKSIFEGKYYDLREYVIAHLVVNLLVENLPILLFVVINNTMLGKWKETLIDPIIINLFSIIFSYICIILFFRGDKTINK